MSDEDEKVTFECGEHYCTDCGMCLHCYGTSMCEQNEDGFHLWVDPVTSWGHFV